MPLFKKIHFSEGPFGNFHLPKINYKIAYRRKELGTQVRKQLNHEIIYRVRPGNGHAGAIAGVVYQDKYKYVVPDSINNTEGQAARDALTAGVTAWKSLDQDNKNIYNTRADKIGGLSGYNLYIKEYILETV